jgi:hypothetical protein
MARSTPRHDFNLNPPSSVKRKDRKMTTSTNQDVLKNLKHGFYSHSFTRLENDRLEHAILGGFIDEENLLRVMIDRSVTTMDPTKMATSQVVVSLRAISTAIGRIESLQRSRKIIYDDQASYDQLMSEMKYTEWEPENDEQRVAPPPAGHAADSCQRQSVVEGPPARRGDPCGRPCRGGSETRPINAPSPDRRGDSRITQSPGSQIPTAEQLLKGTGCQAKMGILHNEGRS